MNPKEQKRLQELLKTFDGGAVQPEELRSTVDSLLEVIGEVKTSLNSSIGDTNKELSSTKDSILAELTRREDSLKSLIESTDTTSRKDIQTIINSLITEIHRVEQAIPTLPEAVDLTDIQESLQTQQDILGTLKELITAENIRNALEAIPDEDEKLKIEAIGHLRKELDNLKNIAQQKGGGSGAIIARYMYQIGDVVLENLNNNATIQYNSSTKLWNTGVSITVSETEPTDPKLNDLWIDTA